jgi:hypothetical protein
MSRAKLAIPSISRPIRSKATQRVPIVIEKFYVQQAGSGKGQLCWTEGKPGRVGASPYMKGKTARHTRRLTVTAPTTLTGLLIVLAKSIGQSAEDTEFRFHTRGNGVCIYAFAFPYKEKAGAPAVAMVNNITSPLSWHRDADNSWTCLPDGMTSHRRYYGINSLLAGFPAQAPMDGWVWVKPRTTDHDRKVLVAMKTSLKIIKAKGLTAEDARVIDRLVVDLIRRRAA